MLQEAHHVIEFKPHIPKNYFVSESNFEKSRQISLFLLLGISQVLKGIRFLIPVGFPNILGFSEYPE